MVGRNPHSHSIVFEANKLPPLLEFSRGRRDFTVRLTVESFRSMARRIDKTRKMSTPNQGQPPPTLLGLPIKLVEQLQTHRGLAASLAQQVAILGIRLGQCDRG